MTPRSILMAATAVAAGVAATDASALTPLAYDTSIEQETLAPSPDAMLAPHAFDRPSDDAFVPTARITNRRAHLQCVPFARREAGVDIHGDANTWWAQAADEYERADRPAEGGVLVLRGYNGPGRGHVAVIKQIVSERMIIVDHANWLNHGEITRDVPVRDVSPNNDWSEVQVWNVPGHHWGGRTYNVQGFILNRLQTAAQDVPLG